jgi:3'-phosphoadenosine 5'-phosphosulfate (PAPS) 3'-phosphatase
MAKIEELYKKSEFNKLPSKKDRTPITEADFDFKKLSVGEGKLEKARGGKLNLKKYSDTVKK